MWKLVFVAMLGVAVVPAMAQEDVPAFEVVSVKRNLSNGDRQSMQRLPGGRVEVTNTPLRRLILTAYELFPQQLSGGPTWIDSDRFDIAARSSENLGPSVPAGLLDARS